MRIRIALLGFGNVGRALARLLMDKAGVLHRDYDLEVIVTGIATRSHGLAIDAEGLDLNKALRLVEVGRAPGCTAPRRADRRYADVHRRPVPPIW